jgi:hypothetical protein
MAVWTQWDCLKDLYSGQKTIGLPVARLASASAVTSFVNCSISGSPVKACNLRVCFFLTPPFIKLTEEVREERLV